MSKLGTTFMVALLAIAACKKKEPAPTAEPTGSGTAVGSASGSGAGSGAGSGSAAAPTEAERAAEGMKKADADAAEEAKRWTPELEAQVVALRDATYADATAALTAIAAGPHRMPKHPERDAARHPIETLAFFGITPTMIVLEVGAGGGWYTELLAPLLAAKGKLVVAGPDALGPADKMSTVYGKRLDLNLAKSPALFGNVERTSIGELEGLKLADDGSVDLAVAIREMHNWVRRNEATAYLTAIHAALKDGGTFGVVAHRAKPDAKPAESAENGYLPEAFVIEQVTAAGFELVEKSELNANPKDTTDHPKGVWTLPPNFRLGDTDRAKYAAIGESDRMTLRFKKVAKPATP